MNGIELADVVDEQRRNLLSHRRTNQGPDLRAEPEQEKDENQSENSEESAHVVALAEQALAKRQTCRP